MMQKQKFMRAPDKRIIGLAYTMSSYNANIWYVCQRKNTSDVLVSDRDINRFLRLGYQVSGAFLNGKRYRNIYTLGGEIHFVV